MNPESRERNTEAYQIYSRIYPKDLYDKLSARGVTHVFVDEAECKLSNQRHCGISGLISALTYRECNEKRKYKGRRTASANHRPKPGYAGLPGPT